MAAIRAPALGKLEDGAAILTATSMQGTKKVLITNLKGEKI